MIVSHKHRFIFMHCLKTAGSSLTIALAPHLDENDVLLIDKYTLTDFVNHNVVPRGFFCPRNIRILYEEGFRDSARVMEQVVEQDSFLALPTRPDPLLIHADVRKSSIYKTRLRQHITARKLQRAFPDVWDSYFKFAIERNPWQRMISLYHWRWRDRPAPMTDEQPFNGHSARPYFSDFLISTQHDREVQKRYRSHRHSNFPIYAMKGKPALDFIGQYENLQADLAQIQVRLGFDFLSNFPAAKGQYSKNNDGIRYTAEMDRIIQQVFHREITLFGYQKPEHLG